MEKSNRFACRGAERTIVREQRRIL
ncbi:MAG TPA: hypothetical protein LFW21_01935 [Rickettsia endosymbiont of Pyrocoelia pectoralis]|nr:hypothetical protein [Rickettsia endosymbiont of Pyrocoelia pectoralis]